MHNLFISGPAALAAAVFFSLGMPSMADPAAQAALSALPAAAPVVAAAAPAPAFRIRGEWVSTGSKALDGLGPADSVSPSGQQAGATLAPGLTFTGASAVALTVDSAPATPAPLVVALYAAERPGLAFIVAPVVAGRVSLVVPPGPALDFLPVSALPASCVQRAV